MLFQKRLDVSKKVIRCSWKNNMMFFKKDYYVFLQM